MRRLKKKIFSVLLTLLSVCTAQSPPTELIGYKSFEVSFVIDGDTFAVTTGSGEERVRLIGLDAPEDTRVEEPYGPEATRLLRYLLRGTTVYLIFGEDIRDPYGRLLAHAFIFDENGEWDTLAGKSLTNVGLELIRAGLAEAVSYPPNTRLDSIYKNVASEARAAERGMWSR